MTHTYSLSGLTCTGCATKVKNQLLKNSDITAVEVSLHPQQAVVSMNRHVAVARLQEAVSAAGRYTIAENNNKASATDMDTTSSSIGWFATFKPLLLIFVFIGGVSMFTSYRGQSFQPMTFMSSFMAGFFLVFSFFKFLDLKSFAASYSMYDLLAMKLPAYGRIYPFIELALGIAFLTGFNTAITGWTTLVVIGFSSIGVIRSVLDKKKIKCACLGAVFSFPMSTVTIVEDLLMVAMAAAMLIFY
jgi:copper chaperone CopZ